MGVDFTNNQVAKEKQRIETTRPPGFAFPLGLTFGEQVVAGAGLITTTANAEIVGPNIVITFTSSADFTPSAEIVGEYLVVAGGGGGGAGRLSRGGGGGAGAGGLSFGVATFPAVKHTCNVGGGAAAAAGGPSPGGVCIQSVIGSNSHISRSSPAANVVVSIGGGFGGGAAGIAQQGGSAGGSGGGGSGPAGPGVLGSGASPANTTQGKAGATGGGGGGGKDGVYSARPRGVVLGGGGGGGGAGAAGSVSGTNSEFKANGGIGLFFSISGSNTGYAGGGGGGTFAQQMDEGQVDRLFGGGAGANNGTEGPSGAATTFGEAGIINRGGGGGGGMSGTPGSVGQNTSPGQISTGGGAGGSGVIIIRYPSKRDFFIN